MKTYDFDRIIDREGTFSEKWNVKPGELPMWVADMDFQTAPEIIEVLERRVSHGILGYTTIPDEWFSAYTGWWERRHHFEMKKSWLSFATGVIPAISSIIRTLTEPGEKVLIQPPVYNCFFDIIRDNDRQIAENELVLKDGEYGMDLDDLDVKLSDPKVRLMILCNPQNPSGMLWDSAVLGRVGELCEKHGVTVISDEIHCDLTAPGYEYVPFASVSEVCLNNSITCIAPTKAFNIAGVHSSAVMISDPKLKSRIRKGLRRDQLAEPGSLSVDAAIAAFNEGEEWLDALREYIEENKRIFREFVLKELPEISVVKGNATYLLWLDFSNIVRGNEDIAEEIRKTTGLFMSTGSIYGNAGKKFARINLACPRSTLHQGMQRLKEGVRNY